jgi:Na+-driven multidrug efflux pump
MLRIGLPAGIQGCAFAISNVLVQSSINSFGKTVMAANTVAAQIDGFIYQAMAGVSLATLAFVSQNYGAGNIDRVKKTVFFSLIIIVIVGVSTGLLAILLNHL